MNDTENTPQQPQDDEPTSGTGGATSNETSQGAAESDPPIIVHDAGSDNP